MDTNGHKLGVGWDPGDIEGAAEEPVHFPAGAQLRAFAVGLGALGVAIGIGLLAALLYVGWVIRK